MLINNTKTTEKIKVLAKKPEKCPPIKNKVNILQMQQKQKMPDPTRNLFAINSLGAIIVILTMFYIYVAGILSLFFPDHNFHFMREVMRILECIAISIVSYFFGGIFKKDRKNQNDNSTTEKT